MTTGQTSFPAHLFGDEITIWNMINLLAIAIGLPVVYYSYQILVWYRRIWVVGVELDKLPGPKKDWFVGNLFQHPGSCEKALLWMMEQSESHGGKLFRWWIGPFRPAVAVTHPDSVKVVLKTAEPKATGANDVYSILKPWLGEGLLVSDGLKWQRNRRLLTPAFHFDILKPYVRIYNTSAEIMLNKWKLQLKAHPNESIEICKPVTLLTLDIILKCACSYEADIQGNGQNNLYASYVLTLADMVLTRFFKVHWHWDWFYYKTSHGKLFLEKCNYVHKVAEEIIAKRKVALSQNSETAKKKYVDFLDILLLAKDEAGNGLSDLEIRDEVDTFLFEGHDTTSSAIFWCMYNLASHPDIQQRAFEEVRSMLENRDSDEITWEDLGEMSYVTMCVKESMRRHPPVPITSRELSKPMELGGVRLLPGTIIDFLPFVVHHNPLVWGEDHMDFRPERFDIENLKNMDSYAFIPFSAGPRNCIGQSFAMHEVKTVIARILNSFRLEVDKKHPIEMVPELILRARHGIKIFLFPRL